ncbi:MAG: ATP-binding protein [Acidobacteriota bacterium]
MQCRARRRYQRARLLLYVTPSPPRAVIDMHTAFIRALLDTIDAGAIAVDRNGNVVLWNDAATSVVGLGSVHVAAGRALDLGFFLPDGETPCPAEQLPVYRVLGGEQFRRAAYFIRTTAIPSGAHARVSGTPIRDDDGSVGGGILVFGCGAHAAADRDVPTTESRRPGPDAGSAGILMSVLAEEMRQRRNLEEASRQLFDRNPRPMWIFDIETLRFLAVNEAAVQHYGYSRPEFLSMTIRDIRPAEDVHAVEVSVASSGPGIQTAQRWRHRKKDGTVIQVEVNRHEVTFGDRAARLILVEDVTDRESLHQQLLQAQKMEAVGQLAGGVAHDFNNLLTAIISFTQFAQEGLPPAHPSHEDLAEVVRASHRAVDLTRQLLAFSRRHISQPKVMDLNELVLTMDKLLRRLLGEDVELVTRPAAGLWRTRIDPSHLEQVIVNLAVNARDAMPAGGKLTIETANVVLGADYLASHPEGVGGEHVMIAVTDNGSGIPPEIQRRIFEPFFTTKELGKGTGLGLSTCHGIVKQAGGTIAVYSEPGRGTTFKIHLPRTEARRSVIPRQAAVRPRAGTETILVAEDDAAVRASVVRALRGMAYNVLESASPAEALRIAASRREPIDLLVTDVVMPGIGGKQLADRIAVDHPETKVLYMSGYADHGVVRNGEIETGVAFLHKPFHPDTLAAKVRETLDGAPVPVEV